MGNIHKEESVRYHQSNSLHLQCKQSLWFATILHETKRASRLWFCCFFPAKTGLVNKAPSFMVVDLGMAAVRRKISQQSQGSLLTELSSWVLSLESQISQCLLPNLNTQGRKKEKKKTCLSLLTSDAQLWWCQEPDCSNCSQRTLPREGPRSLTDCREEGQQRKQGRRQRNSRGKILTECAYDLKVVDRMKALLMDHSLSWAENNKTVYFLFKIRYSCHPAVWCGIHVYVFAFTLSRCCSV